MPETKCRNCRNQPVQCGYGLCFYCYHTPGVIEGLVKHYRFTSDGRPLTGTMAGAERFCKTPEAAQAPAAASTAAPTVVFPPRPVNPLAGLKARGPSLEAVRVALPNAYHPGHEERIAAHSERVLAELAAIEAGVAEAQSRPDAVASAAVNRLRRVQRSQRANARKGRGAA